MGDPMKWLKRRKAKNALELSGTFQGEKVYTFKHPSLLPVKRYLYFVANNNDAELGIARSDLKAFVSGIRNAVNGKDLSRAGWYCETLDFYLNDYNPEKMLFKSGAVMICLQDEDPLEITDEAMKKKAQLFDTDDEFRAFFLQTTYELLKNYGVLSSDTPEEAFTNLPRSRSERIFSKLTGRATYWDYLKE
jgi:hypothetical protein